MSSAWHIACIQSSICISLVPIIIPHEEVGQRKHGCTSSLQTIPQGHSTFLFFPLIFCFLAPSLLEAKSAQRENLAFLPEHNNLHTEIGHWCYQDLYHTMYTTNKWIPNLFGKILTQNLGSPIPSHKAACCCFWFERCLYTCKFL